MFVQLLQPWKFYAIGRILNVTPGVADVLITRSIAKVESKSKKTK